MEHTRIALRGAALEVLVDTYVLSNQQDAGRAYFQTLGLSFDSAVRAREDQRER